jgi:hypothetical protein
MAQTYAPDPNRLPWLADERVTRKNRLRWWMLPAVLLLAASVFAIAFWFGMKAMQFAPGASMPVSEGSEAPPAPGPASPSVEQVQMPQVQPAPPPAPVVLRQQQEVRIAAAEPERRIVPRSVPSPAAETAPAKTEERKPLAFSNPWDSKAASGRMVRVGTYSTLRQGKQAWSRLARVYPAMKTLPAVVTDIPSARNGRVYYRLQIGTTSQAHSEVLCQRMKAIGQSCVVVDLAGARKGSGDGRQPVSV